LHAGQKQGRRGTEEKRRWVYEQRAAEQITAPPLIVCRMPRQLTSLNLIGFFTQPKAVQNDQILADIYVKNTQI
jgi:hypothetical protein